MVLSVCLSVCEPLCAPSLSSPSHPPFPSLLPLAFTACARGLVSSLACDLLTRTAPVPAFSLPNNDAGRAAIPRAPSTMSAALAEPFTEPVPHPPGQHPPPPAGAEQRVWMLPRALTPRLTPCEEFPPRQGRAVRAGTLCSCLQTAGSACSGGADRGFSQLCPAPACSTSSCAHACADASLTAPHSESLQTCTGRCSPLGGFCCKEKQV